MSKNICPIMSRPSGKCGDLDVIQCKQGKCQFWTSAYTTEPPYQEHNCAFVINALKDINGKIPI